MLWTSDNISYTHHDFGYARESLDINRWTLRFTGTRNIMGDVKDVRGQCAFERQI